MLVEQALERFGEGLARVATAAVFALQRGGHIDELAVAAVHLSCLPGTAVAALYLAVAGSSDGFGMGDDAVALVAGDEQSRE